MYYLRELMMNGFWRKKKIRTVGKSEKSERRKESGVLMNGQSLSQKNKHQ